LTLALIPVAEAVAMALTNPVTFFQQVRTEVSKITWPTRNETIISSIMVLIFVAIISVFFMVTDQVIAWLVTTLLSF
jgi:preprotein translocase subunit SecE